MLDWGGNNLDDNDIIGVMAAAPMINNNNQLAPENLPSTEDSTGATDNIMGLWTHSGICERKATIQRNAKPELTFWMSSLSNPSNLNLFKGLFFSSFIKTTILPQTNQNLPDGENAENSSSRFFQISCSQGILNSSRLSCYLLLRLLVYMYLSQLMRTFTNYLKCIVISS